MLYNQNIGTIKKVPKIVPKLQKKFLNVLGNYQLLSLVSAAALVGEAAVICGLCVVSHCDVFVLT